MDGKPAFAAVRHYLAKLKQAQYDSRELKDTAARLQLESWYH